MTLYLSESVLEEVIHLHGKAYEKSQITEREGRWNSKRDTPLCHTT